MKRLAVVLSVFLILVSPAVAVAASDPRVPALKARITVLERQVQQLITANQTLTASVQGLQKTVTFNQNWTSCFYVKQMLVNIQMGNLIASVAGVPDYSGPYPDDKGACAASGWASNGTMLSAWESVLAY